jgi:hypothetical protein
MNARPFGFRVAGHRAGRRRLVDWRAAFAGYAACDPAAQLDREAYLSHFVFGADFADYLERNGSEGGYSGPCGADVIHWDIDRADDLDAALSDARRLAARILYRYRELDDDDLLIFPSGAKGFHIGVPTALWGPMPSTHFHDVARRFCQAHAERAGVAIDMKIYSRTRLLRAANSRHARTGLYKRRLALDELMNLSVAGNLDLAREPMPFAVPTPSTLSPIAAADWADAAVAVERRAVERRVTYRDGSHRLTKTTLAFIREGAVEGERAVAVFRAAANLAEMGCPDALAHALLTDAALDSGLMPSETRRQIDCGLAHARQQEEGGDA